MAQPRRIITGATYLITRRTYQRTHRLRPDPLTNQIAEYCLAVAANATGVLLHGVVVMSNHHHLVVTDVEGRLPDFMRELHRTMAKALNASQGQWENLWSAESASAVRLVATSDILDKIAYTVTNPVTAALVKCPRKWPGVVHWYPFSSKTIQRPCVYFDPLGSMPPSVLLRIVPPPQVSEHGWRDQVEAAITARVRRARREVENRGSVFLGAAAVKDGSILDRANAYEVRRTVVPKVAAKDGSLRARLIQAERRFQVAYREALERWRQGAHTVLFPFGTWWMRVHHRAHTAPS